MSQNTRFLRIFFVSKTVVAKFFVGFEIHLFKYLYDGHLLWIMEEGHKVFLATWHHWSDRENYDGWAPQDVMLVFII